MNGHFAQALHDRVVVHEDRRSRARRSSGIASRSLVGRWKLLLSQLPGRFCAPRSIEPSSSILPGTADADEGGEPDACPFRRARSACAASCRARSTACSRDRLLLVGVTPQLEFPTRGLRQVGRLLEVELDHAGPDVGSADVDRQDGVMPLEQPGRARGAPAPISPASSGSLRMGTRSMSISSALRITPARAIASSPTRVALKPPPTTMRSVSCQAFSLRKRRMTSASSWAKSSIAPCSTPAASGLPLGHQRVQLLLADLLARLVAERIVARLAQRLAPFLQDVAECALAGAVAEKAVLVLDLDVVAVDLDRRQAQRRRGRPEPARAVLVGHGGSSCGSPGQPSKRRGKFHARKRTWAPGAFVAASIACYRATIGCAASAGSRSGTPRNSEPSSNHDFGAGWPHRVWRCGSRSDQRIGSRSGSTVR